MAILKDYLNLLYLNFNIFLSFNILDIQAIQIHKDTYGMKAVYF